MGAATIRPPTNKVPPPPSIPPSSCGGVSYKRFRSARRAALAACRAACGGARRCLTLSFRSVQVAMGAATFRLPTNEVLPPPSSLQSGGVI